MMASFVVYETTLLQKNPKQLAPMIINPGGFNCMKITEVLMF